MLTRVRMDPWLGHVLGAWAASRAVALVSALLASTLARNGTIDHHPKLTGGVVELLTWWDGRYYLAIAEHGYPGGPAAPAHGFFPLLPAIMRAGASEPLVALMVANVVALAALVAIAALTARLISVESARRTVWLLAFAPGAIVLAMAYTEGLTLALGVGAVLALTRGRLTLALALGIACGLTRPQGFAFVLPLVVAAWRLPVPRRPFALAAAAGPVAGLALFAVYLHVHAGDALAYAHAQEGPFQARTSPGLHGLVVAVRLQYHRLIDGVRPWEVRDLAATVGYLGLLAVAAWRRLPWEWVALGAISLLLPLAAGSMAGTSRYALLALPVFWLLARAARWQLLVALSAAGFVANLLWLPTHWP